MGKFHKGDYYMEYITTGRLTIGKDSVPVISPIVGGQVSYFVTREAAEAVKELTPVAPENIQPDTNYIRLFQAPEPVFDADGELMRPRYKWLGVFEPTEVSAVARGHLQDFCSTLSEAVLPFFKDEEQTVCPIVATEVAQA